MRSRVRNQIIDEPEIWQAAVDQSLSYSSSSLLRCPRSPWYTGPFSMIFYYITSMLLCWYSYPGPFPMKTPRPLTHGICQPIHLCQKPRCYTNDMLPGLKHSSTLTSGRHDLQSDRWMGPGVNSPGTWISVIGFGKLCACLSFLLLPGACLLSAPACMGLSP